MDASPLIALLASPPLLTPLHIQLQAFFFCSPSIKAPRQEGGFGGRVGTGQRRRCGDVRGHQCWMTGDPGQTPVPKTLTCLPASPPMGPRWLGTTSGQEGRQRLKVSAAVMAMARLRPFFRITTIEEVYSRATVRAHTHTHTQAQALFRLVHQRQKNMNKYMSSVGL